MSTPLWVILLPIGISCAALTVSVLTYVLASNRDEEAREFLLRERHLAMVLHFDSTIRELEGLLTLAENVPVLQTELEATINEVKKCRDELSGLEFAAMPTRKMRRLVERAYAHQATLLPKVRPLRQKVEAFVKQHSELQKTANTEATA